VGNNGEGAPRRNFALKIVHSLSGLMSPECSDCAQDFQGLARLFSNNMTLY
jgi:hypothetical protein